MRAERETEGLTAEERGALGALGEEAVRAGVRLHRAASGGAAGRLRALVLALSGNRAVALGTHVFLPDDRARDLPTLAHELTHCVQYRRWGPLRYYCRGALEQARELAHRCGLGRSPYAYRFEPGKPFDAYGMEQQGQIVEDCFRGSERARGVSPYSPGAPPVGAEAGLRAPDPPTAPGRSRPGPRPSP